MSVGQEMMEAAVWVHQEKTEAKISAIGSTLTEVEETVSKQVGDLDTENQDTTGHSSNVGIC
jgi:hypothetical protein